MILTVYMCIIRENPIHHVSRPEEFFFLYMFGHIKDYVYASKMLQYDSEDIDHRSYRMCKAIIIITSEVLHTERRCFLMSLLQYLNFMHDHSQRFNICAYNYSQSDTLSMPYTKLKYQSLHIR